MIPKKDNPETGEINAKAIYEDAKMKLLEKQVIDRFDDSNYCFHFKLDKDGVEYFKTWLENRCPKNINVIYDANSWLIFEDL